MRAGRVKINLGFFQDLLHFPPDWKIEELSMKDGSDIIDMVISGSDFPEVVPIQNCELIVHKENVTMEVKPY
jgi:hypothetical protein